MAMLGTEVNLPVHLALPIYDDDTPKSMPQYVKNLQENMQRVHDIIRQNSAWSANREKRYYDTHTYTKKRSKPFDKYGGIHLTKTD